MSTPIAVEIDCSVPGGRVIERPLTSEEIAQREVDALAAAEAEAARLVEEAAKEEARLSARAKLIEQGFTDAEIDIMYPTLVAPPV